MRGKVRSYGIERPVLPCDHVYLEPASHDLSEIRKKVENICINILAAMVSIVLTVRPMNPY